MPFQKLQKPKRTNAVTTAPILTFGLATGGSMYLALNRAARAAIGDPVAIVLYWDDDTHTMRLTASSLDDPAAYKIASANARVIITGVLRDLGLTVTEVVKVTARKADRMSIDVDCSDLPTAPSVPALHAVRAAS